MTEPHMRGSKRERRRRKHAPRLCGCWHCMSSKAKLHSVPRPTRERMALTEIVVEEIEVGREVDEPDADKET